MGQRLDTVPPAKTAQCAVDAQAVYQVTSSRQVENRFGEKRRRQRRSILRRTACVRPPAATASQKQAIAIVGLADPLFLPASETDPAGGYAHIAQPDHDR